MAQGEFYQTQRGDTIVSIAQKHGFRAWEPIWNHEQNAALREARLYPDVLAPGDKIFIPAPQPKDYQCETNKKHTFHVRSLTQRIQQIILDEEGAPLANKSYEIKAGAKTLKNKTDAAGKLTEEIPLDVKTVELKLWRTDGDESGCLQWTLDLGHLEPPETTYGFKGRLTNLGYDCGEVNDQVDDKTRQAARAFQQDYGLTPSGENDAATQSKLRELHDGLLEV